jgi:kumamolisin
MKHHGQARPGWSRFCLIGALLALAATATGWSQTAAGRRVFPDSVVPVGGGAERGTVMRTALTGAEAQAPMDFSVSLQMRNFAELQARLAAGEQIAPAEMAARYLPLQSDYDRTAAWLESQGFTLTLADPNHTNLFASGPVAAVATSFGVTFARVATADGEFTSAITAPSLPADLAGAVLNFSGLQPHVRRHVPRRAHPAASAVTNDKGFFTPSDITAYYRVPANLTGAGQTIAIIMDANVQTSDLTAFWTAAGLTQTIANLTVVPIGNGATSQSDADESTLDVQWAGGIAPAAKLRLYTISSLADTRTLSACTQILKDAQADPTLRVVSMSFGGPEITGDVLVQAFAQLAAAGITICAASGDGGSNPNFTTGFYSASSPLAASYPGSDPNVTSVGGTTVGFDGNFNGISETTWFQASNPLTGGSAGSGGGISAVFARPSWQTGTGVPAGSARCVPDVAVVSDGSVSNSQIGGLTILGGTVQGVGGTSLAVQVFGGLMALSNQSRATAGRSSLGLLGPFIYPLIGSSSFNDITTGNNGAYSAGVGYDLATGIGSPNLANLALALGGVGLPTITAQPQSVAVNGGAAFSFTVTATGGSLAYQWYFNGAAISGATSATYAKSGAAASDAGSYLVVVSNPVGSATSTAGILTVITPPTITGQPQSTSVNLGNLFSFSVTAAGSGLAYQWSLNGAVIAGATGSSYVKGISVSSDAGSYTVAVSNVAGTVTSSAATLTVVAPAAAAPAAASGGGGGGGAPSLWFDAALALLAGARLAFRRREAFPA